MNKLIRALGALALGAAAAAPALAVVDVGVGVTIREPGVYGRIEIGTAPPPPVYYPQPVIITRPAVVVAQPPLYLYVPPGHAKNWRKHCGAYNACGRPVYLPGFFAQSFMAESEAFQTSMTERTTCCADEAGSRR